MNGHVVRGLCSVEGCGRKQRSKGRLASGKQRFGNTCIWHYSTKARDRMVVFTENLKKRIPNAQCVRCGWDEGPCDRHRIDPQGEYSPENVRILCPNCHRLVTFGIIQLEL